MRNSWMISACGALLARLRRGLLMGEPAAYGFRTNRRAQPPVSTQPGAGPGKRDEAICPDSFRDDLLK